MLRHYRDQASVDIATRASNMLAFQERELMRAEEAEDLEAGLSGWMSQAVTKKSVSIP